ncbi:MAG: hypothetical protein LBH09_07770 [Peptococcaceae bacterium]|jgi:hypothetical protein|nr:hypothetical protein [Peptococcaceae bacterium]
MGIVSIKLSPDFQFTENAYALSVDKQMPLAVLLDSWGACYAPDFLAKLLNRETGMVAANILIILNGYSVKSEDPMLTMVSPGDNLFIAPILLGG